ncbi:nuclear transport factor 2 family protein [Maritalea porphyrae]|uniref:Nuclear transport factor 2 family protein n=1 Tax=Maritalea porphyrae TaxID=880732 RepID=A0ABQ5UQV0_9HYPH|nr:nuclear transport factor 2 family protein [Maritalea porphyrae]GLQ17640.1 hypothetical protein GCM10007879_18890 [Maritalea porphyrae]
MTRTEELLTAINTYLDVIYYCDVEKLEFIFHPSASLFDADEGKIFVDPVGEWRKDVASRPSPAGANQKRDDNIVSIDWLSDLSAVVKLRLQSLGNVFVDHLSFVYGENGWKIVAKVWHLDGKAPIETL